MADLEENIFKENIPGRWSTFERREKSDVRLEDVEDEGEEVDENGTDGNDDAMLGYARALSEGVPEAVAKSIFAKRDMEHATGVKGVLADYRASCEVEAAISTANLEAREALIRRMVEGHKVQASDAYNEEAVVGVSEEEEDAFMQEYRRKRLAEIKVASARPLFGKVIDVDSDTFIKLIDEQDAATVVVVHLFEPSVQECVVLNRILEQVSKSQPHILFLRMPAAMNKVVLDRMTLPILVLYKGGETLTSLVGIAREFDKMFTVSDIEWLLETTLQSHGLQ